jgi:Mrp family chromosome partitioning ATPase
MTILEALERAKLLRKTQGAASTATRVERRPAAPRVASDDTGTLAILPEGTRVEPMPTSFAQLERVAFDAVACERHHVLLVEEKGGHTAQADAAYRMLRSRVQHRIRSASWTCIGMTSPGPGEGKTVTTLNLAICIAREKQRPVYLIDLDLRSPSVLEYCGIQPPQSLARFFTDHLPPEQVLFATDVGNLVIAGARAPAANASELLATQRLEQLLAHVRARSPDALIIIDLPPVMSTDEALVVAPRTDAMFLIISEGRTRRDALKRSLDQLGDFNVAGIILNRSSEHLGAGYYGY